VAIVTAQAPDALTAIEEKVCPPTTATGDGAQAICPLPRMPSSLFPQQYAKSFVVTPQVD
jgi:hypothetical protein